MINLKIWLKNKLRNFLEVDNLQRSFFDLHHKSGNRFKELEARVKQLEQDNQKYKSELQRIIDTTHLGVDVRMHPREHSWAVVCIPHKLDGTPHIDFFDLSGCDPQHIKEFFHQFKGNQKYLDATPTLRQFILK